MKELYFITTDNLLGDDHDAIMDGTHPHDLGFDKKLKPAKMDLLAKHEIYNATK
ncbi:SGNH/GDSL hydrolase family protein [Pseudopedobacter beijingensis]|uniref:SGNH/GDSL hydrolase family protein n=1 Tax=Pseudopedobacter beijingensis TaxID=1207056 RepID=A0ABW4IEN0_9SPHI